MLRVIDVGPLIQKEPSSLLIPNNEIGHFSCHAQCKGFLCTGYWIISEKPQQTNFNKQGMWPWLTHSVNGSVYTYTLTLTVNASDAMNNTTIQCEFEATGDRNDFNQSAIVKLFVISSKCK